MIHPPRNGFLNNDSPHPFPVLLVEDDCVSRMMTERVLAQAGYPVTSVENGRMALELFQTTFFPIVLTDWMMPEMDGIALCRAIRSLEVSEYVFIVFLTTNDSKDNIVEGLEAGADDYLTKPFDPVELKARLASGRRILELEQSHREVNTRLKNSLQFSETLMNAIPNPVFYYNDNKVYMGGNRAFAGQILGAPLDEVAGHPIQEDDPLLSLCHLSPHGMQTDGDICITEARLKCADGISRDFLLNKTMFSEENGRHAGFIGVMVDISEKNRLLEEQQMNVEQAKGIMTLINSTPSRHTRLNDACSLFIEALSMPCHLEGGDHFFSRGMKGPKTLLSLKDQSGHEVDCILRSIATDLLFHTLLTEHPDMLLEKRLEALNTAICQSDLFRPGDFFTAIHAEIDHQSLKMRFSSSAHPSFFLIREKTVTPIPHAEDEANNLPLGILRDISIKAGEIQLQPGDRLLFYTDGLLEIPLASGKAAFTIKELQQRLEQIVSEDAAMPVSDISEKLFHYFAVHFQQKILSPHEKGGPRNDSDDDVTLISVEIEDTRQYTEYRQCISDASHVSSFIKNIYEELALKWEQAGFKQPESRLRTVLEEAVQNAWRHGNREQSDLSVTVRWRLANDFVLEVLDEGEGFDHNEIPDPTRKETRLNPSGRGIFLMHYMADLIQWYAEGAHLVAKFKKDSG